MTRIRRKGTEAELSINIVDVCAWEQLDDMVTLIRERMSRQLDTLLEQAKDKSEYTEVKFDLLGNLHCKKTPVAKGKPAKDKEGEE